MEYKVSAFKVIINGVKAYSWIIRSLVNNGCNPNALAELDYNTGVIAFDIYIWPIGIGYASYWIIRKSQILPGISWLNFIIKSVLRSRSWVITRNIIKANGLNY